MPQTLDLNPGRGSERRRPAAFGFSPSYVALYTIKERACATYLPTYLRPTDMRWCKWATYLPEALLGRRIRARVQRHDVQAGNEGGAGMDSDPQISTIVRSQGCLAGSER